MKQQHRSCHKHAISHAYHADPLSHSCYHHLIICPPPCSSNPSRVNVVKKANNGATLGSRKLPHRVPPLLAGWPSMMAARTNRTWSHLELWSGSRADPRSLRGAEMARYRAPATDRVIAKQARTSELSMGERDRHVARMPVGWQGVQTHVR